jgi:hypothetical protein
MQIILGRKKRNTKTTKLFSLPREALLYKERKKGAFSISKWDKNSY